MLSRVLMAKPSPIKAAPKPKAGPKPATEYFAEEEAAKFPSPAYSLGGLNIFASGDDGEPRSRGAWTQAVAVAHASQAGSGRS